MKIKIQTLLNFLYIILILGFIWLVIMESINYNEDKRKKEEIHKLNIEKLSLEIEILKNN